MSLKIMLARKIPKYSLTWLARQDHSTKTTLDKATSPSKKMLRGSKLSMLHQFL